MTRKTHQKLVALLTVAVLLDLLGFEMATGQEEMYSALRRYKAYEQSTGFYEEYEVRPRRMTPFVGVPGVRRGRFRYSPTAAQVRIRTRLVDSHRGIKFYKDLRCQYCHVNEAKDIHTVRANLTCRQCHGGEPIASLEHFYSPMNPIRRHAYVCAKCHEGASVSFASYVIHEPAPGSLKTLETFPILFLAYWFMVLLLAGALGFMIPHSLMVGVREAFTLRDNFILRKVFKKKGKGKK